jgi:hypothetical protein
MTTTTILCAFALFAVACAPRAVRAQSDSCITFLKTANGNFEQRDFDGSIRLLRIALDRCSLDREEEMQARKLLALSYLAIDNLEAADGEGEAIMRLDPNYTPDKFRDEPSYSALFEKYRPVPVFRAGLFAGVNRAVTIVDQHYSIAHNDADASRYSSYTDTYGFHLGSAVEYRAFDNIWLELQGQYRSSSYTHTLTEVVNSTVTYKEELEYIDVPLSAKYIGSDGPVAPYITAGATLSFLVGSLGTTSRDNASDIVDRLDYRNTFSIGYFFGVGALYRVANVIIFADLRYLLIGKAVNKEGTRYADQINVFKYYYTDDDFRLNNAQLNVGLKYNFAYEFKK